MIGQGLVVGIKIVVDDGKNEKMVMKNAHEIAILSTLSHPHVTQVRACDEGYWALETRHGYCKQGQYVSHSVGGCNGTLGTLLEVLEVQYSKACFWMPTNGVKQGGRLCFGRWRRHNGEQGMSTKGGWAVSSRSQGLWSVVTEAAFLAFCSRMRLYAAPLLIFPFLPSLYTNRHTCA